MIFRKSFSIFSNNVGLLFKLLIYCFVLLLLCLAVIIAVFRPIISSVFSSMDLANRLKEALNLWLNGGASTSFRGFISSITGLVRGSDVWSLIVSFVIVLALFKFFLALTYIPVTRILYGKMSENFSEKFYQALVSSLGKSLYFALIYLLITLPVDLAVIVSGYYLFKLLYPAFSILALTVAISYALVFLSVKNALLSQWVPIFVAENLSVNASLRKSFAASVKCFRRTFPPILLLVILIYSILMSTAVITFAILPILSVPAYLLFLSSFNLTAYFISNDKKFYVDEKTVEN
jgi:hypothetical protein